MRPTAKLGLTALAAALLLSAAVSAASARNLEFSNSQVRVTWSRLEFASAISTIRCQVTLEGSFHSRTIAKVERTLIGATTRVPVKNESCTNGTAGVENLPWHISYESFAGTLPNITSVRFLLTRFRFRLIILSRTCIYGISTNRISVRVNLNAEGTATNLTPIEGSNTASLFEGPTGGLTGCPTSGTLASGAEDGRVTLLNSTATIRIRLI